jgi:serine/threonine-protein kinase
VRIEDRRAVDRALAAALELEGAARGAFVAALRRDAAEIGAAVSELLGFAGERGASDQDLEEIVGREVRRWRDGDSTDQTVEAGDGARGRRFGAWQVIDEVGRGGMSVVYRVERADGAYRQRAALKRLSWETSDEAGRRRFQQERQILAGLQHPDIARLLDGGVDDEDRPFLVLELIEGEPIDRHCDGRRASIDERLRLFVRVARAVAYAHRSLVVHRDVKPANVLVGGDGEVKLLDFGIAAPLAEGDRASTADAATHGPARWLTPDYASPEQLQGLPITTASDVYQLGLLLFELLCGRRARGARGGAIRADGTSGAIGASAAVEREAQEELPPPSGAVTEKAAGRRGLTAAALRRRLRGDLDSVVLFALRREPERRYRTAEALAEDVERHLSGLPVEARRGSLRYRAGRWLRRYRWPAAAAAVLVALLLAYAATVTAQAARLRRQMATTERVSGFLAMLVRASSWRTGGAGSVRPLLDRSGQVLVRKLAGDPAVRAELQSVLGEVYNGMGLYAQSCRHLEAALASRRRLYGDDDARTMSTAFWLARTHHFVGHYPEAAGLYQEILAWRRRHFGPDSFEVTESEDNLACLAHSRGDWAPAEEQLRAVLRKREERLGESVATAITRTNLADLLLDRGSAQEAESHYRRALATFRRELGAADATTTLAQAGLGHALAVEGRLDLAETEILGALAVRRLIYSDAHPLIAESLRQLGLLRFRQGRLAEAGDLLRQAFAMHASLYNGPFVSRAEAQWAAVLLALREERPAVEHAGAALRRLELAGLGRHPFAALAREVLAHAAVPSYRRTPMRLVMR